MRLDAVPGILFLGTKEEEETMAERMTLKELAALAGKLRMEFPSLDIGIAVENGGQNIHIV